MADVKISQLPAATTPLAGTEEVPLVQSGVTKKATVDDIVAAAGGVTAVTGTAPVVSSGGTTPDISMAAATTSASGYLTSTDWNTFNGKIGTLTSTDGTVTITGTGASRDLSVPYTTDVVALVRNSTGATLTKGTVVYITGATGQTPTVSKALASSDATSAQTLGMLRDNIANNATGYVTVFGLITNIDTSAYTDGAQLYLSGTTAGAVTTTKPYAPIHLVYVGVVEYAHATNGKILVKVQNGYELDELHNVSAQTPSNGQTIVYNSSTQLWENSQVGLTNGVTGVLPVANGGNGTATPALTAGTNVTITGTWPNYTINATGGSGGGDVSGPASSTDNAIARFDGTTGKLIQNSGMQINDSGEVNVGVWKGTEIGIAYGGTAASTASQARGNLLPSYATNAGKVLAVNTGATDVEWISAGGVGTVTSVALSMPSGFSVSGSPVTSSGTLAVTTTLSGVLKGTGSGITAATAGTDYAAPGTSNTFTSNQVISDNSANAALRITQTGAGNALLVEDSANPDSTPFIVTTDGQVVSGSTSTYTISGTTSKRIQSISTGGDAGFSSSYWAATASGTTQQMMKSRGATVGDYTVVQNGDTIGTLMWGGADGTAFIQAASIIGVVDSTPGTNDMPGRLVFCTTADGASSPTERFRISNFGGWGLAGANYGTSGTQAIVSNGNAAAPTWQDVATPTATQTLTNKTISGASNTLSNIGNSSLTNSSVTVNGTAISLGASGTVTATATNALTIGTGLSGTSYNGSSAVTVAIDSTVATLTGSQTLTNKTLTNPTVTNYVETPYSANSGTAITLDLTNGTVQIITLTGNATITMPTAVSGKSFIMFLKQDATGSRSVTWTTVKWAGGTAPTITGTASRQDIYSFFSDGTNWYGVTVGQNYTP